MKLRRLLLAAVLAVNPIAALAQQVQTGVSPPPPVGASPPYAPLGGCVYMPNGVALAGYVGPMGLTCGANGGLNVNVLAGGGGGGGAADQTGTNATDGQATSTNNQHSLAFNYIFNGSTWDRMRGVAGAASVTEADGANATLGSKADTASAATGSSLMAIERQLHADLIAPTPAGSAIIGKVGIDQTTPGSTNAVASQGIYLTTPPTLTNGQYYPFQLDASGNQKVVAQASTAIIGKVTTDQTTHGTTDKVAADLYINGAPNAAANPGYMAGAQYTPSPFSVAANSIYFPAIDTYRRLQMAETGSADASVGITPVTTQAGTTTTPKASAGNLYSAYAVNQTATAGYLVCINSASTITGTITPIDVAYLNGAVGATAQINYGSGPPNAYSAGIACGITTSLTTYTAGGNAFIQVRYR